MQPFFMTPGIRLTAEMPSAGFLLIHSGKYVSFYDNLLYAHAMSPYDILYILAYMLFLCGAALACRGVRQKEALWIMGAGMLINFFSTVIPNPGCQSLAIGIGSNGAIIWAITLGVAVWAAFLAAVFVRLMGRKELFFFLIVCIKLCWFADLILFIYGVYALTG